jgi:hypothetical protein
MLRYFFEITTSENSFDVCLLSLSCKIIKSLPNLALIAGKICFSSNISYPKLVKDLVKKLKKTKYRFDRYF